ncbi:MAG TPA: hypothetical protein VJS63_10725 [Bradyrhizobium sp.]|nr:hypothetical protein [Bradyrhizobium sp.]
MWRKLSHGRFATVTFRQQPGKNRKRNGTEAAFGAEYQGILLAGLVSVTMSDDVCVLRIVQNGHGGNDTARWLLSLMADNVPIVGWSLRQIKRLPVGQINSDCQK